MGKSQKEEILNYLKTNKSITPLEALRLFGAYRLSAIIYDLKKDGHKIISTPKKVKKANGDYSYVAEYMLEKEFFKDNMKHIPRID